MEHTNKLIEFIKASTTAFHTVEAVKRMLLEKGFTELSERETVGYADGGKHFVVRGGSSVIAFSGGKKKDGFMIAASHTDFPAFKLTALSERAGAYLTLPTEKYGGSILYTWLDRPLSVAGRVVVKRGEKLSVELFDAEADLLVIPSVAIHQNRGVNDGYKFNPATDMQPLFSTGSEKGSLKSLVANRLNVSPEDIVSSELYVYNREEGRRVGRDGELILSPRLDNLASVYTSLEGFLSSPDSDKTVKVFSAFNNEEVGSSTREGANSTFLSSVLKKVAGTEDKLLAMLEDSFMVSLDNSHAKHPNHPELSNPDAAPLLGKGVAVKYNANHLYTTDAVSDAMIRTVASLASVPLQSFSTRADMPSGSTLGSIATTRLGVCSVDLGIPQLAMHSSAETCAASDIEEAVKLLAKFYSVSKSDLFI